MTATTPAVDAPESIEIAAGRVASGGSRRRPRWPNPNLRGLAFALGLVATIELLTATVIDSAYIPRPTEIAQALFNEILHGSILSGIGTTLAAYAQGLAIATVAGVILGAIVGASHTAYQLLRLVIEFLRPLPAVALIPFSILLLGIGSTTTVAMVTYASFWPILFNTYYGVQRVNPVAVDTARIFGLHRAAVFFRVQIPSAAVSIAAGIRISAAIALILVITVEILTRNGGLGYYIIRMQVAIRTEEMYAGIFLVGLIGYVINALMATLERRIVFWNSDLHEGGAAR